MPLQSQSRVKRHTAEPLRTIPLVICKDRLQSTNVSDEVSLPLALARRALSRRPVRPSSRHGLFLSLVASLGRRCRTRCWSRRGGGPRSELESAALAGARRRGRAGPIGRRGASRHRRRSSSGTPCSGASGLSVSPAGLAAGNRNTRRTRAGRRGGSSTSGRRGISRPASTTRNSSACGGPRTCQLHLCSPSYEPIGAKTYCWPSSRPPSRPAVAQPRPHARAAS